MKQCIPPNNTHNQYSEYDGGASAGMSSTLAEGPAATPDVDEPAPGEANLSPESSWYVPSRGTDRMPASAALLRGRFETGSPTTPRVGRWVTEPEGYATPVGQSERLLWDWVLPWLPSEAVGPCAGVACVGEEKSTPEADSGLVVLDVG